MSEYKRSAGRCQDRAPDIIPDRKPDFPPIRWKPKILMPLLLISAFAAACTRKPAATPFIRPQILPSQLQRTGYTIQVGAFRNPDNAVRLAKKLTAHSLDAYYFKHDSGLYKVRFGDFADGKSARAYAEKLKDEEIIQEFYIVAPESFAVSHPTSGGALMLREEIVQHARSYLGLPYQYGGTSPREGFDCSGLTMAVYKLVGLNLPHSSRAQFAAGTPIGRRQLKKGDLVFFSSDSGRSVSHVGIFTGGTQFIHAPSRTKKIRMDSLSDRYFRSRYAGARTYLIE